MKRMLFAVFGAGLLTTLAATASSPAAQQPGAASPPQQADTEKKDEGIPVASTLVRQRCGSCHRADDQGRMTRISYRRTTPEGWEQTIKRMVTLNDVKLDPSDARDILRYLADHHGLAPEEARPGAFEVERRMIDYKYTADKDTEETCIKCHSFGRVLLQRRTKEEWELLIAMHRGYYPLSDFQAFRRGGPPPRDQQPGPDGRPPDNRHPMDKAIAHLSTAFPLTTPEWSAWAATMRPPRLQGKWAVTGTELGKGPFYGVVMITPQGSGDTGDFTTETTLTYASSNKSVTRRGRAIVYTGFQWRGKSDDYREVLTVDRDWRRASGRWFSGAYDEFGMDVQLTRIGNDAVLLGVAESRIRSGGSQEVQIFGVNLPAQVAPADLNFGPGVTVDRIVSAAPDRLTVAVTVAPAAGVGRRAVYLAGASGEASVAVFSTIDFIRVLPQAGMARVGGANFPKQFQQFEAVAFANGPDGKPDTKDDVDLGLVDHPVWSVEEYTATYDDDDKDFVGTVDAASGLFTPNLDGPNPKRKNGANNYGDVWVVATYQAPAAGTAPAKTLKARAHLLVTVPLYMKWDQPEVSR